MDAPQQPEQPMSRRERRELRRAGQRDEQVSLNRMRTLRRVALWMLGLALVAGVGWGMVKLAANAPTPSVDGTLSVPVGPTDHAIGLASASVTLVEYSDFQCPACAAYHPLVKQLVAEPELQGKLRFVYRHFPLVNAHKNAMLAARAAEAAAVQGKFWEMHDKLFETQSRWSNMSSAGAQAAFTEYATALGLDGARFTTDLDSSVTEERVRADMASGLAAGVNATPTFFINGKRMPQVRSYDEFKQLILTHATP